MAYLYRNESLLQMETHHVEPSSAEAVIAKVREKWAMLREKGFAGDYPVQVLRGPTNGGKGASRVKIVEVFRWKSAHARVEAEADSAYQEAKRGLGGLVADSAVDGGLTDVVRGFNNNFPSTGGVELLKGVCSCLLMIDGMVENYPMSVKNGIVLMHRSPRMDQDGDGKNEMYLKILMHGGEITQAALGPIRVEQNFNMPNDGIVKSNGEGNDFPGSAIWRVAWKIQTAFGPVLTDPATPLIFGPAAVSHYPPVGTRFHSPTGPVALLMEGSNERIGTLVPGELTAFDIVVTKDDEVYADMLNQAPPDILSILADYSARYESQSAPDPVPVT
jgi:hypothetical protein